MMLFKKLGRIFERNTGGSGRLQDAVPATDVIAAISSGIDL